MSTEQQRLDEAANQNTPWKKWGPYLSDRQWGTVREDYSDDGNAWSYFSHDQARSRAYHWGEDGLAGICDDRQRLCFALALWNGRDPIIKERLFGLTYPTLGDLYKYATYAAMLTRDGLVVDDSVNEAKSNLLPRICR
jgi:hypothetical protein